MTDSPRPQPVRVSVQGTRTLDGADCTLLASREAAGTWMIHSVAPGERHPEDEAVRAVRLPEDEAVRFAKAILHLVGPHAERAGGVSE